MVASHFYPRIQDMYLLSGTWRECLNRHPCFTCVRKTCFLMAQAMLETFSSITGSCARGQPHKNRVPREQRCTYMYPGKDSSIHFFPTMMHIYSATINTCLILILPLKSGTGHMFFIHAIYHQSLLFLSRIYYKLQRLLIWEQVVLSTEVVFCHDSPQ